jgi:hypothetical protein
VKNENPRYPEPYWNVTVGRWTDVIRCSYSDTGCDPMKTKDVYVTVRLTVPEDLHLQELINELGYQFTYVDDEYNELIMDSELTNAEEINNG